MTLGCTIWTKIRPNRGFGIKGKITKTHAAFHLVHTHTHTHCKCTRLVGRQPKFTVSVRKRFICRAKFSDSLWSLRGDFPPPPHNSQYTTDRQKGDTKIRADSSGRVRACMGVYNVYFACVWTQWQSMSECLMDLNWAKYGKVFLPFLWTNLVRMCFLCVCVCFYFTHWIYCHFGVKLFPFYGFVLVTFSLHAVVVVAIVVAGMCYSTKKKAHRRNQLFSSTYCVSLISSDLIQRLFATCTNGHILRMSIISMHIV